MADGITVYSGKRLTWLSDCKTVVIPGGGGYKENNQLNLNKVMVLKF